MSGFYDPCPEEEKMLRIRYLFRDAMHEVTFGDKEPVRIPKQCKPCCVVLHASHVILDFSAAKRRASIHLYVGFPFLGQSQTKLAREAKSSKYSRSDKLHVQLLAF